uniref:Putative secreted protein n=1 Tax=Ixodes ricinus TaxID=34613 RepID=A0A6B0URN2_IXORI
MAMSAWWTNGSVTTTLLSLGVASSLVVVASALSEKVSCTWLISSLSIKFSRRPGRIGLPASQTMRIFSKMASRSLWTLQRSLFTTPTVAGSVMTTRARYAGSRDCLFSTTTDTDRSRRSPTTRGDEES